MATQHCTSSSPHCLVTGLVWLLTTGCASGYVVKDEPKDCTPQGRLDYIQARMTDEYLWAEHVTPVDVPSDTPPADLMEALRYDALDRWSYVLDLQEAEDWFDSGAYVGGGYTLRRDDAGVIRFALVYPDNPAARAGLTRGDALLSVGGIPVEALQTDEDWDAAFGPDEVGTVVELAVQAPDAEVRTATLVLDEVVVPPVMASRTFEHEGRTVLYFMLTSFIDPAHDALDALFATVEEEAVDTVVVDVRYNGGGLISVARHLAGLVAADHAGEVFLTYTHNAEHARDNTETLLEEHPAGISARDVVFLTSGSTASASEMLMVGLEPYTTVGRVGGTTAGKPVGMNFFEACDLFVAPITFQTGNRQALGTYFDGLAPDCTVDEDLEVALGSGDDPLLAAALSRVITGDCPSEPLPELISRQRSGPDLGRSGPWGGLRAGGAR